MTTSSNKVAQSTNAAGVSDPHAQPVDVILEALDVSKSTGLSSADIPTRRERYGRNELPQRKKESAVVRFMRQFKDVLIYILLGSAVLTAVLGEWIDMSVILAVVLINAIVGFVQEGKAEKALEGIANLLSPTASVYRDSSWHKIDASDLVPGDIIRLAAGDRLPADVRLFDVSNLSIEEAALTGESVPAEKALTAVDTDAVLGDRTTMAYSSTIVTTGNAQGIVVATGADTEIGRISSMIADVDPMETPLTKQLASFSVKLAALTVVVAIAMALIGAFVYGDSLELVVMAGVSFAVAAIPEGLPALITITLALGVQTMAKHNAFTRKLPAVQTLGSVTVICTDKTGTLTRNEMTVTHAVVSGAHYTVSGSGYEPRGTIRLTAHDATTNSESPVEMHAETALLRLAQAVSLANDTDLEPPTAETKHWSIVGEPTEGALAAFAAKIAADPSESHQNPQDPERLSFSRIPGLATAPPRLATLPFSSDYKLMAVTADIPDRDSSTRRVVIKGAPDRLLSRSTFQLNRNGLRESLDTDFWRKQIDELSAQGLRVLAAVERAEI